MNDPSDSFFKIGSDFLEHRRWEETTVTRNDGGRFTKKGSSTETVNISPMERRRLENEKANSTFDEQVKIVKDLHKQTKDVMSNKKSKWIKEWNAIPKATQKKIENAWDSNAKKWTKIEKAKKAYNKSNFSRQSPDFAEFKKHGEEEVDRQFKKEWNAKGNKDRIASERKSVIYDFDSSLRAKARISERDRQWKKREEADKKKYSVTGFLKRLFT